MTISTTTSVVTYAGNGVTTVFSFPFVGDNASTLEVLYTSPQGVISVLAPTAYTLTINPPAVGQLWGIGGVVTYPIIGSPPVPISTGSFITIQRIVPYEQTVTISNQGSFYPQAVEQALDLLELQIQQLVTDIEYTLQFPLTDPNPPNVLPSYIFRAGGYLAFDVNGQPYVAFGNTPPTPGGSATTRKVAVSGTNTVSMTSSDAFGGVSVYQSGTSATTVQLPSGGPYPVFDGSGNAGTYPLTVLPPAGLTINGQTSYILAFNYQSAVFFNDGTQVIVS